MYFPKTLIILAAAAAAVSATPSMKRAEARDVCNDNIGDCYSNGCSPSFAHHRDTIGSCTAGYYKGCPCEKCGGITGDYVGSCSDNGCNGYQGECTAGNYNGCPCN